MKVTVKKRNLDAALQVASLAVGSGEDSDIATHYLIRHDLKTGVTTLLAQDGKRLVAESPILECTVETDATGDGDGFTVPGWRFRAFLNAVEDGEEAVSLTRQADRSVKAQAKGGSGKWGSLNPKDWPFWTTTLTDAKVVATISAAHLTNILSYAKKFVSDQESRSPAIVAAECRNGVVNVTDSVGVVLLKSPKLKDSSLRVHGKDITSLISFLGLVGEGDVEIREHNRILFLQRSGTDVRIGASRWIHDFPILGNIDADASKPSMASFRVNTADFLKAMTFLLAFGKKDDGDIYFRFDDPNIILSMRSGSGSTEEEQQVLPCIESTNMADIKSDGNPGFTLTKRYLESVATTFGEETMLFRVDVTKKNGYVSFFHERDGDTYYTAIVWIKSPR